MPASLRLTTVAMNTPRRFASTLSTPSPLLHPSLPPPKPPIPASRGRTKPSTSLSLSHRLFTAKQNRPPPTSAPLHPKTQGRRSKSTTSTLAAAESRQIPPPPIPFLHFTPPNIPFNHIAQPFYTTPEISSRTPNPSQWDVNGPFQLKPKYAFGSSSLIGQALEKSAEKEKLGNGSVTGLEAHLSVMRSITHGDDEVILGFERELLEERVEDLGRLFSEVGLKNRLEGDEAWKGILQTLGDKPTESLSSGTKGVDLGKEGEMHMADKSEMESVVGDLKDLLIRLDGRDKARVEGGRGRGRMIEIVGPEGEVESVWMDSTQRKRRKKISKHKYQKRRKAQAALRKHLKKD